jgi:xylan 1,4-beta-xylosidase
LLREFDHSWFSVGDGKLQIQAKNAGLDSLLQPAFISRRQQHMQYETSTQLAMPAAGMSAGLVAFQNEQYHYYLGVKQQAKQSVVFLEQAAGAAPKQLLQQALPALTNQQHLRLKISGQEGKISFYYAIDEGQWQQLGPVQDGKMLSTEVATGFVGTMLGLYSRLESSTAVVASGAGTNE